MRFRASIINVSTFFRIVQAIEKLQKKCLIKFTEREMHIICNNDANEGGIQVWSQIKADSIFVNYRIQSNASNEITLALSTDALLGALKSASASASSTSSYDTEEIVVKLAKKNDQAALTFEINGMTRVGMNVRVSHEVKIEVLRPADVERLSEPLCPEPDVHIVLPPLQKLRTVVDRLRLMSDTIAIRANNNGKLRVSIRTESVKVDTEWINLMNPKMAKPESSQDESEEPDPDRFFTILISTRTFLKFLSSHVISTTTIACICQHHCMILYVYIGDAEDAGGVLTFYIPAILNDGD